MPRCSSAALPYIGGSCTDDDVSGVSSLDAAAAVAGGGGGGQVTDDGLLSG